MAIKQKQNWVKYILGFLLSIYLLVQLETCRRQLLHRPTPAQNWRTKRIEFIFDDSVSDAVNKILFVYANHVLSECITNLGQCNWKICDKTLISALCPSSCTVVFGCVCHYSKAQRIDLRANRVLYICNNTISNLIWILRHISSAVLPVELCIRASSCYGNAKPYSHRHTPQKKRVSRAVVHYHLKELPL